MATDPTYPAHFAHAEAQAARILEDEARRRAREGVRKPVLYQGKQVYATGPGGVREPLFETEFSDSLMALLLKGNDPSKFKERIEQINV
jgi:hypothetical protein